MNKDHVEGSLRSAMGQGEKVAGQAMNDPRTTAQGIYDDAAGKAQSAWAAPAMLPVEALRFRPRFFRPALEVSKLTQMVADLAQRRVSLGGSGGRRTSRGRQLVTVCSNCAGQVRRCRGRR